MIRLYSVSFLCGCLVACSWVQPHVDSHHVALVKPELVQSCQKLSVTTSKSLSKVLVVVPRKQTKVMSELIILAKNQAAVLGGDTITAEGPMANGEQSFGIYKCLQD